MIRGAHPRARRIASVAVALGAIAGFGLFIAGMVSGCGDADRYGRVPLPGQAFIDLPAGDVALYYEERVSLSENESLDIPRGLTVEARREVTVRSKGVLHNSISTDDRALEEFAKLSIPEPAATG
jgi:hypothetical protein